MKLSETKKKELYKLVEEQSWNWDKHERVTKGNTWRYHCLPVIKIACEFAKKRGADSELVEISALFHDYGSFVEDCKHYKTHHIESGRFAEPILLDAGYSQEFVNTVKQIIFCHRGSVEEQRTTPEEVCLADADGCAHIENVFQMIMWVGQRGDTIENGNEFIKGKINRTFKKLSKEAQEYSKEKYEAVQKIFY